MCLDWVKFLKQQDYMLARKRVDNKAGRLLKDYLGWKELAIFLD